jgi:hypothetical protein
LYQNLELDGIVPCDTDRRKLVAAAASSYWHEPRSQEIDADAQFGILFLRRPPSRTTIATRRQNGEEKTLATMKVEKNITYIPGHSYTVPYPYYNSFYGYYPVAYRQVYSPDYLREDKTVRIETNLYATATPEGELVWTGISDSFNPSSAKKAINNVVKVVVKDLEKERIF